MLLSNCKLSDRLKSSLTGYFGSLDKWYRVSDFKIIDEGTRKASQVCGCFLQMGKFCFTASQLGFFSFKPLLKEKSCSDEQQLNFHHLFHQ